MIEEEMRIMHHARRKRQDLMVGIQGVFGTTDYMGLNRVNT